MNRHPSSETGKADGKASVYELIRRDIISGRLAGGDRLKVAELTGRYSTSTNPAREALQQLRGEGFVIIEPNRGARVRPIDENFVRDIMEIQTLLQPSLTHWFIGIATEADIESLIAMAECWAAMRWAIEAIKEAPLDKTNRQNFLAYNEAWSKWCGKFGLSPADRAKVAIVPRQDTDEKTAEAVYFG